MLKPGNDGVSIDPTKIARSLVILMLLPLGAGLLVKARFCDVADRIRTPLNRISSLSLVLLIVLLLVTNIQNVIGLFGTRGILASILFLLSAAGIGSFFCQAVFSVQRSFAVAARSPLLFRSNPQSVVSQSAQVHT